MVRPAVAFAAALALALAAAPAAADMNPCHENKPAEAAPACGGLTMPAGLCGACTLRPPLPSGDFADCTQIYDLDAPGCKGKLQEYVAANPCDTRRKELVEAWDADAKTRLDYFAYSMCEQCCDNIEAGSTIEEYDARAAAGTLWTLARGNGPAHFYYDICTIFPGFTHFVSECEADGSQSRPQVCPVMKQWVDDNPDWFGRQDISAGSVIDNAIEDGMYALTCGNRDQWTQCLDLEQKQNRVR